MTQPMQIINLGKLPSADSATAYAISGDGSMIVGESAYSVGLAIRAFRSQQNSMVDMSIVKTVDGAGDPLQTCRSASYYGEILTGITNDQNYYYELAQNKAAILPLASSGAAFVSPDGKTYIYSDGVTGAAKVDYLGTIQTLIPVAPNNIIVARGVADSHGQFGASIAACSVIAGGQPIAVYWPEGNLNGQQLNPLPGDNTAEPYGISSDGNLVCGVSYVWGAATKKAVVWNIKLNTVTNLGIVAGYDSIECFGISPNGIYLSGTLTNTVTFETHAFRYDADNGMIDLGVLNFGEFGTGYGVADNGDVVGSSDINAVLYHFKTIKTVSQNEVGVLDMPAITPCLAVGGIFTKV